MRDAILRIFFQYAYLWWKSIILRFYQIFSVFVSICALIMSFFYYEMRFPAIKKIILQVLQIGNGSCSYLFICSVAFMSEEFKNKDIKGGRS